ncbi:T9SS type A sorting domain-containing protein [Chryseobacterium sp.]|uniref:T9SS type A sorting domain-containing protein n=1 Tax=Chryseobacterium sp. TaxID=1871047 RepID=UPI0011CA3F96|nr:T9SS type A sorting domain-containing protein [Chryseobacterium sp.]TXF77638.1 T9SS type A sorting domain-containing protein [Chryseobacterium sp.]
MKKLRLIYVLLIGLMTCQMYVAQNFTVSQCSTGIATNTYGPMNSVTTANSKNRTAFIIPASQLQAIAGGNITSTYFRRMAAAGTLPAGTTFSIYLKNTAAVNFPTAPTWATEIASATLVYNSDPAAAVGNTAGFKQFLHTSGFVYTSGSNLAVYMEYVQTTGPTTSITWDYEYGSPCVNTATGTNTTRYQNTTGAFTATLASGEGRRPVIAFDVTMPPATVAPACTTVSAPANAATGVSITPTISWAGVYGANGASSYLINLGTTPGGTNVLNSFNAGNSVSYTLPSTSPLMYNTAYYLTVIPTNNVGNATGCTETSFTTINIPCPSVSSPGTAATGTSLMPTINWAAVNGATGYRLSVGTTAGGTNILNNIDLGNVFTYSFSSNLSPNTQYFYTVYSYDGINTSTGCTERNFTTGSAVPPANDNCANAIALTVNPSLTCTTTTPGNTLGATQSQAASPCFGNPDDDVWYSFVATNPSHVITLSNVVATGTSTSTDTYFQVLSGTCGTLTSVLCSDPLSATANGLTPGQTYYVRVYSYAGPGANQSFNICISTPPPPPANDDCANAVSLTVNPDMNCGSVTPGTTLGGTNSGVPVGTCSGTPDDDVWYSFTATATSHTFWLKNVVSVGTSTSTSLYAQIFSGTCGSLTSTTCITSNTNYSLLNGLTVGQTYYVRVYNSDTNSGATFYASTFDLCIGTLPAAPVNDNCANAVTLSVNPDLNCVTPVAGTTLSATNSGLAVTPCAGTADDDVWYSFIATSTGHMVMLSNITAAGTSTSVALNTQVFSGVCGTLVSLGCGTTANTPVSGLTPGQTYYVRVYNSNTNGTTLYANNFNICIGTIPPPPANDDCANAVSLTVGSSGVCSNPVSGSTISATASTGTAPTCAATGINDDVWYSFTATSTTHLVNVAYSDNATATQVYSGTCGSLTAIACFSGAYGNSNVLLSTLNIGQTYYVRVYSVSATAATTSNFQICITTPVVPTNDTCATAIAIAPNGSVTGNNALATADTLPASTCGSATPTATYNGVWYTVTSQVSGPITISACGTAFDAYMRVYTGDCSTLTCVANTSGVGYADSGCSGNNNAPTVTFTATAGTTYYVYLTSYSADQIGYYTISTTGTLGTSDVSAETKKVSVYPNPFHDVLNISDVKDVISVTITDISGRTVKTIAKPTAELQLGSLTAGMYLVTLKYKDGSVKTMKAIKK